MPCGEGPGMEWTPGTGGWGGRDHSSWVAKSNLIITPPLTTPIGGTTPRRDQEEGLEMGRAAGGPRWKVWGPWLSWVVGHPSLRAPLRGMFPLSWTRVPGPARPQLRHKVANT